MADPTTLQDLWTQRLARAQGEQAEAYQDLGDNVQQERQALAERAAAATDLAQSEAAVLVARQALAEAELGAQAQAKAEELRKANVAWARARAATRAAEQHLLLGQAAVSSAVEKLAWLQQEVERATEQLAATRDRAVRVQGLKGALLSPDLANLQAEATAATQAGAEPLTSAQQRLASDLPQALRLRAISRHAEARQRQVASRAATLQAEQALLAQRITVEGPGAAVEQQQVLSARADAALEQHVRGARNSLSQALADLQQVASRAPLATAQAAFLAQAALQQDREDAASAEAAVAQARGQLLAQEDLVRDKRLELLLADPHRDDLVGHTELQPLVDGVLPLEQALAQAEQDFSNDQRQLLDEWEAEVPEHLWRALLELSAAEEQLGNLATPTPDPTQLVQAVDGAESDLVAAMLADDRARRGRDLLRHELQRARAEQAAREPRSVHELAALRGET